MVVSLCLRLVSSRHLRTAGEAAACLLAPLLPLLASQAQSKEAARAAVDLLKHCVEAGGEAAGGWLLPEQSSVAEEELGGGAAPTCLALPPAPCPSNYSSDGVAVLACKVLRGLLHAEACSSSAAGVVVEERGLAALVTLLAGRGSAATALLPDAAGPSTADAPSRSPAADAILGDGVISHVATELGEWATDCLFGVMEVCAAEGATAQVRRGLLWRGRAGWGRPWIARQLHDWVACILWFQTLSSSQLQ